MTERKNEEAHLEFEQWMRLAGINTKTEAAVRLGYTLPHLYKMLTGVIKLPREKMFRMLCGMPLAGPMDWQQLFPEGVDDISPGK